MRGKRQCSVAAAGLSVVWHSMAEHLSAYPALFPDSRFFIGLPM